MDAIRTTNYWTSGLSFNRGTVSAANRLPTAINSLDFFSDGLSSYTNSTTSREWNDLPGGFLPDDRWGVITGVFIGVAHGYDTALATFTGVIRDAAAAHSVALMEALVAELYVGGTLICRGSGNHFSTPGPWISGSPTAGGAAIFYQNSGFMLQFTPHEIHPRAAIRVNLKTRTGITLVDTAGAATTAPSSLVVALQTVDQRGVFSGGR